MRIIADLHLHSKYSRATSREMDVENMARWCKIKGITIVGTGDFTHPVWLRELKAKLKPTDRGLYTHGGIYFMLTVEVSNIYPQGGRLRKIHNIVHCPSFEVAERINAVLGRFGALMADGRPTLTLPSDKMVEYIMEVSPDCLVVPAHAWTPWFSLFGSNSGFDSLVECFGEQTKHIYAAETGLSSDPPMNWRLSQLDSVVLLSNSDAHSPAKLGREANVFDAEPDYYELMRILREKDTSKFLYTIEFFPEEGKYHVDGHRKCGIRLRPQQTLKRKGLCPSCGKPVTVGVLSRIEKLADRPEGERPPGAAGFQRLIPLKEVLGQCLRVGPGSVKVDRLYHRLLALFGSELHILRELALPKLEALSGAEGPALGLALARMRRGEVAIAPGYDGEYGTIALLDQGDLDRSRQKAQLALL
ncbi:MAG: DNA helicase UvrD [Elusimicrobia bacterium]|nr:DNA helicase UvrD [Elusimicrobiota bacterium]